MTVIKWLLITITVLVVGAALAVGYAVGSGESNAEKRDRCLYAAIEQAPTIPPGKSVFDLLPECKDLPKADQEQLQEIMVAFMTNAVDRIDDIE